MYEPKRSHLITRGEFERNLYLLKESILRGQLKISRKIDGASGLTNGLMKARGLPNRRIDFATINESVRLMANTVSQQHFDTKKDEK